MRKNSITNESLRNASRLKIGISPLDKYSYAVNTNMCLVDTLDGMQEPIDLHVPMKLDVCIIMFCQAGDIRLRMNQRDYTISGGQVMMAMPGVIMESMTSTVDTRIMLMAFNREKFANTITIKGTAEVLKWSFGARPDVITLPEEKMNQFFSVYTGVRDLLQAEPNEDLQEGIVMGLAYVTMGVLRGAIEAINASRSSVGLSNEQKVVVNFYENVQRFAAQVKEVEFYAEKASLTPKHFARIIIRNTGKRPKQIINQQIALEAKMLIGMKQYTMKEIADMLDFFNTSSFTRFFRMTTGLTPNEYLKTV